MSEYGQQFRQRLDPEAAFIQSLNIELKSQHIYADALLQVNKRKKPGILHLEVQTAKDPEMGVRLLEYNVLASRQYDHLPVSSYVIYLRDVKDVLERRSRNGKDEVDRESQRWLAQEKRTCQEEEDATITLAATSRTFRARRANREKD